MVSNALRSLIHPLRTPYTLAQLLKTPYPSLTFFSSTIHRPQQDYLTSPQFIYLSVYLSLRDAARRAALHSTLRWSVRTTQPPHSAVFRGIFLRAKLLLRFGGHVWRSSRYSALPCSQKGAAKPFSVATLRVTGVPEGGLAKEENESDLYGNRKTKIRRRG